MKTPTLSPRLAAIAALVRPGVRLSDVGTDHGYLPGYLLYNNKISFAVASDIAKAPLAKATEYLTSLSLSDRSATVLTPGLQGIEQFSPDDIVIAGMGGELITSILSEAPFVKNEQLRLILQPMTKGEILHQYLAAEGFSLLAEKAVEEEDKIYRVLHCRYTGTPRIISDIEAEFSEKLLSEERETVLKMLKARQKQLNYICTEKKRAAVDTNKERALLDGIDKILQKFEKEGI